MNSRHLEVYLPEGAHHTVFGVLFATKIAGSSQRAGKDTQL
jgi:hypothetical protein